MTKYRYNATNRIAETFEERGVKFDVRTRLDSEQVLAGFPIDCGPSVLVRFISRDGDNDVAVRVLGLLTKTPKGKRFRIMEACNILNNKIRHVKFVLDEEGDISVEYDFPIHTPDVGVGEMAFEIFVRMMRILNGEYNIFMKALYSNETLEEPDDHNPDEIIRELEEMIAHLETEVDEMDGFEEEDGFIFDDVIEIVGSDDSNDDGSLDGNNG